tara:strand:- start:28 stop:456 length:429 start_codon:yes stop_codon:yes gene_type:complete
MKELKLKLVAYDVYRTDDEIHDREDNLHVEYFDEQKAWDFVHAELLEQGENMPPYDERDKILPKNKWLFGNNYASSSIISNTFEQVMAMSKEEYNDKFEENIDWWNSEIERFRVARTTNLIPYSTILENLINTSNADGWTPS